MADKLKKSLPVRIRFTNGEVITGAKLNTVMSSLERSLFLLEKAIGDIHDDSYPYFESSKTLSQTPGAGVLGTRVGSDRKLEQVNLARLIGPASALNPVHITDMDVGESLIVEALPGVGHVFSLKYKAMTSPAPVFSGDSGVFTTKVTKANLNAAGEYSITSNDQLISFSEMDGGTVTYYADLGYEDSGLGTADPTLSSHNVIPDPSQTTKCTAAGPTNGKYRITLPVATHTVVDDTSESQTFTESDLGFEVQLRLPVILQGLAAGEEIPGGFLCLRDDDTGVIYTDANYYYYSETQFDIGGTTINTADRFSVITVGSNITETLLDLKLKLWKLRRGRDGSARYPAGQISNATGPGTDELYAPSDVPFNYFPQYLHRDGWFDSDDEDNINDQNGMRGDLVLLSTVRTSGSRNNITSNSQKIRFGHATNGPSIGFTVSGSDQYLDLVGPTGGSSDGVRVQDTLSVVDGIYGGDKGIFTGPIKWYMFQGTTTLTGGSGTLGDLSAYLSGKLVFGICVLIEGNTGNWHAPGYTGSAGYRAYWSDASSTIAIDSTFGDDSYNTRFIVYYMEP